MKLAYKLVLAGLFLHSSLTVSAQCADNEKQVKKIQEQVAKIKWSSIKCLDLCEKEIKNTPDCFYWYALRGENYTQFTVSQNKAIADFKKAKALAPLNISPYWNAAYESYFGDNGIVINLTDKIAAEANKAQNTRLCIEAYTFALSYKTTADFLIGRGDCYYNSQQYDSSVADYYQGFKLLIKSNLTASKNGLAAILSYPNITGKEKFYMLDAQVRSQLKEFDGAIADCKEALKIDPNLNEAKKMIIELKKAIAQNANAVQKKQKEEQQAAEQKIIDERSADEKAESFARDKMAKENPTLFRAYSEAIENKNYQYLWQILSNKKFYCTDCYVPTIQSAKTGNTNTSYQYYNFTFSVEFLSGNALVAVIAANMKYDVKVVGARDNPDTYHPGDDHEYSLVNEYPFSRGVQISVSGNRLYFETIKMDNLSATLSETLDKNPEIIEGLKWDCDCEDPESYYIPANKITESFLYTSQATIKSINYRGKISFEMLDSEGRMQTFTSV